MLCSRRVHRGGDLPSVVSWPRTHPCFQLPPFPLPLLSLPHSGFDCRLSSFSRVGSCPGREAWGWGVPFQSLQAASACPRTPCPHPLPNGQSSPRSSFQPLTSGCPSALERCLLAGSGSPLLRSVSCSVASLFSASLLRSGSSRGSRWLVLTSLCLGVLVEISSLSFFVSAACGS